MSPRAFDPGARARDFPRMPAPWRQTVERQVAVAAQRSDMALALATQPMSNTPIEILTALPDPVSTDIGNIITVLLPGETLTRNYIGVLNPDSTITWQVLAAGYLPDDGGATSPEFSFLANVAASGEPTGIFSETTRATFVRNGSTSTWQYTRATGLVELRFSGNPTALAHGLHFAPPADRWIAVTGADRIEARFGVTSVNSPTARDYWGLYFDAVSDTVYTTDFSGNRCQNHHRSTLVILNTFATDCSGPKGIATDSAGKIYVADTGNNRIRRYSAARAQELNWGSAGSGDAQFDAPQGMAFDASDRLYVADSGNDRIQVFDTDGNLLGKIGESGSGSGQLSNPTDVRVSGNLIDIADSGNNRLSLWERT